MAFLEVVGDCLGNYQKNRQNLPTSWKKKIFRVLGVLEPPYRDVGIACWTGGTVPGWVELAKRKASESDGEGVGRSRRHFWSLGTVYDQSLAKFFTEKLLRNFRARQSWSGGDCGMSLQ